MTPYPWTWPITVIVWAWQGVVIDRSWMARLAKQIVTRSLMPPTFRRCIYWSRKRNREDIADQRRLQARSVTPRPSTSKRNYTGPLPNYAASDCTVTQKQDLTTSRLKQEDSTVLIDSQTIFITTISHHRPPGEQKISYFVSLLYSQDLKTVRLLSRQRRMQALISCQI